MSLQRLRAADAMTLLKQQGMPAVWRRSIAEALYLIELLDARIAPIDHELAPLARADARVVLLDTIPGIGSLLGLTLASEIGDVARFGSPQADRRGGCLWMRPITGAAGSWPPSYPIWTAAA